MLAVILPHVPTPPTGTPLAPASGEDPLAAAERARARAEAAEVASRRLAQRLGVMQDVTAALSSAHDRREVVRVILEKGVAAMGARAATIRIAEGDALALLDSFGYPADLMRRFHALPIAEKIPSSDAYRLGEPVFASSVEELLERWPGVAAPASSLGDGAWAAIPLSVGGRPFGVLALAYPAARPFDLEERALMISLAEKCAQALERARLYEVERELRAEAERVGRLQERLLAVVGHDLRTPLSAIAMGTTALLRAGGLDARQVRTLERIAASAERMGGILRDLLDFSRARQGGGFPVTRAPADLRAVATRAVQEVRAAHPARRIDLEAEGDATLEGDESRLGQMVSNLVGNAVQHGDPAAPVVVRVEPEAEEVVLRVHNEGPPIAPALLPELFEPFRRGAPEAKGASVGLGLFIVREIVRAHGGEVEVRSEAGQGTTFSVRLPRG